MKKVLFLIVVWAVCGGWAKAQTGFDVLWKIDNWGTAHGAYTTQLARFSPDGKSIYFVVDNGSLDKSVVFQVSSETGADISHSERTDKIYDFDMSEVGNVYITLHSKSEVMIWDTKSHKLLDSINTDANKRVAVLNIAISPDEKYIIYNYVKKINSESRNVVAVYDLVTKQIIKEIPSFMSTELRYSRDGKTFVAGGVAEVYENGNYVKKERLALYDATTWTLKGVLAETNYQSGFRNIHYSFDGMFVAATATEFACLSNVETLQTRNFNNDVTYGAISKFQLLQDAKDYYINYYNAESRYVIYNDDEVVNSYKKDYWHVTTGNADGKFRIFVDYSYLTGDMIGVLKPSPTSVMEKEDASVAVKYSEDYLTVTYSGIESQKSTIIISNISGKEMYSGTLKMSDSDLTQIPLKLDTGIYLYRLVLNNQEFTGKFEVVK